MKPRRKTQIGRTIYDGTYLELSSALPSAPDLLRRQRSFQNSELCLQQLCCEPLSMAAEDALNGDRGTNSTTIAREATALQPPSDLCLATKVKQQASGNAMKREDEKKEKAKTAYSAIHREGFFHNKTIAIIICRCNKSARITIEENKRQQYG